MKKILNAIMRLNIGGAEKNAVDIFKNLTPNKYDYHFLVFDEEPGDYEAEVIGLGATIVRLPEPKLNYKKFIEKFNQLLEKEQYDVIHATSLWNSGLLLNIAKKHNIPVRIAHSHSTESSAVETMTYKAYKTVMKQWIRSKGTDFIGCGQDAGGYLYGERFFSKHGQIIYNGVDLDKFSYNQEKRDAIRKELNVAPETFVLGHVGRLAPVKNHPFMIDILKALLLKYSNVQMFFVGDGPDSVMLQDLIVKHGLEAHCHLLGKRSDIDYLVQGFDVMLFPSLYEGFPVTLIEAQASSLPCLISENVTQEAVVLNVSQQLSLDTVDVWVETLEEFITHPIERQLVDVSSLSQEFDSQHMAAKWEAIYDREV